MFLSFRNETRLGLTFLLTVLAAVAASAQRTHERPDPATLLERNRRGAEALGLVDKARDALRLRQFDRVTHLADLAVQELEDLGGKGYAPEAHEVLAESALLQGRYAEVLREADACDSQHTVSNRFAMTKALALIGLGRREEARAIVLGEIGTLDKPGFFRSAHHVWRFPFDDASSDAALKATAYLIRSAWTSSVIDFPESLEDLNAAVALAPRDAMIQLQLARAHQDLKSYDLARAEFAKASQWGDERIRGWSDRWSIQMEEAIVAAKAKTGG